MGLKFQFISFAILAFARHQIVVEDEILVDTGLGRRRFTARVTWCNKGRNLGTSGQNGRFFLLLSSGNPRLAWSFPGVQ